MADQPENDDLESYLRLLQLLEAGDLDAMECPACGSRSVSVSFTHPGDDEYRTWFKCSKCGFKARVQNAERPKHFSSDRVDASLEAYDSDLLRRKKLP